MTVKLQEMSDAELENLMVLNPKVHALQDEWKRRRCGKKDTIEDTKESKTDDLSMLI